MITKTLYTISYFSKSNLEGSLEEVEKQIMDILAVANSRNSECSVTGALLYSGGYFVQVLEGPEEKVEEIFESIQNDIRHNQITVIKNGYLEKRSFSKWSMALAGIKKEVLPDIEGILSDPENIDANNLGKDTVKLLSDLLNRYEEEGI